MSNMYSWTEIKHVGNCIDFIERHFNEKVKGGRCRAAWRNGDNDQSVSVKEKEWYDHGAKTGGTIIDLCAIAMFNGDLFEAATFLGDYYRLSPCDKFEEKLTFVCAYKYDDPDTGEVIHETVRFKRKDGSKKMMQRRPDPDNAGKHIYNLDGVTPILYNAKMLRKAGKVIICEGEKCVDELGKNGLIATTNAMGAGKWLPHYNEQFKDKFVCILPDNDEVGTAHARNVAANIMPYAKAVKIVELPGLEKSEDVYEYLNKYNHTKDELVALINSTPAMTKEAVESQATIPDEQLRARSEANEEPLANYEFRKVIDQEGEKNKAVAIPINKIIADVHARMFGFPRRVGSILFDHDIKTGKIRTIENSSSMAAWIQEKTGQTLRWSKRIEGAVTYEQLFASLYANAPVYQMISGVPHFPVRNDVYYTHGKLPDPSPDSRYFNKYVSFFNFETENDMNMFRVFVATCIYYSTKIDKPIFIFDSNEGQGVGKTKAVEYTAMLIGGDDPECGEPLWIDAHQLNNESTLDRIVKRLLSASGRKKRVFLLDNVEGYFRSPALATLVTQGSVSGMAPYGKGEETRPNDLVYVITANSATLAKDITSRSVFITMKRPTNPIPSWEKELQNFIHECRLNVVADVIAIMQRKLDFDFTPATRFKIWEREVMAQVLSDPYTIEDCFKYNEALKRDSDSDTEEAETLADHIAFRVSELLPTTTTGAVFIGSSVLDQWCGEAIPGFGGQYGRNTKHKLRAMCRFGLLPNLVVGGHRENKICGLRGVIWGITTTNKNEIVAIIKKNPDGAITIKHM